MARLFPVGDYPPTDQELVILRILRSRPHHGWTLNELLDELSKGRARPMSYSALAVHMTHLRRKGYAIKRQVVYCIGNVQRPHATGREVLAESEHRDELDDASDLLRRSRARRR
jgi:DNA-binding PadR family transcriptional regulator